MHPADAVNPATGEANPYVPEVAADPVPFYEALRTQCPVATFEGFGRGTYIVSRYEDVRWALKHPEIFSSDIVAVDIGQDRPLIPLQIDPPEHAKYRRVIDPTLGPHEVAPLEGEVRALVNELIDRFIDRGAVDAHAEFTVPLPCTVFLQLCGLPMEDLGQFLTWKDNIIRPGTMDPEEAARIRRATGAAMYAYFEEALTERERHPGTDLLSRFFTSEVDGRRMSKEEMLDICYLFILGGLDTVTSTLDCSLAYLAANPSHRDALAADLSLVPAAVEELLRYHTPVMQILRVVKEPVELRGVRMEPGDTVMLMLGAADTDPEEFGEGASEFDLHRDVNRHLAFGGGPHRCLGSHLARFELRIALEEWHRRIPEYSVPDGAELVYSPGIREIAELPLEFRAAVPAGRP
jgi:cytochrome P450